MLVVPSASKCFTRKCSNTLRELLILIVDIMAESMICIEDFEKYATRHLTPSVRDYYNSGAGEMFSLKLNVDAFKK